MVVKSDFFVLARQIPGVGRDEHGAPPLDQVMPDFIHLLGTTPELYRESKRHAEEFLALYWNPTKDGKTAIDMPQIWEWLKNAPPLDPWFLILLVEAAGEAALRHGYSRHKSKVAAAKNNAPRTWVVQQWKDRRDTQQSKASFGRQYASLVKKRFRVDVTSDQISRVWLPKG